MANEERPYKIIERLVAERSSTTDADLMAELSTLEPLPDERDSAWSRRDTWERAYLFVALGDLAAARSLRQAARLLLERACYGDPGEMMRGLRHTLEATFKPEWRALAEMCIELARSSRPGTRLWAVDQLGVLREPRAFDALVLRLHDPAELVRSEAITAVQMLCDAHADFTERAEAGMREALLKFPNDSDLRRAVGAPKKAH